ncbi:MAG: hypothetical protein WBM75_08380 [Polyangiales bacterium]
MTSDFKLGAVAVIDALGWKGVWRRNESADVLATLDRVGDALREGAKATNAAQIRLMYGSPWPEPVTTEVLFFSDTIVIAAWVEKPKSVDDIVFLDRFETTPEAVEGATEVVCDALLDMVGRRVAEALRIGATSDPPLLYRGAMTKGDLLVDGTRFLGEAIDQAASFMDAADAAMVWVPPSTDYPPTDIVSGIHTVEYAVPVKRTGGGAPRLCAQVVNPFLMCREQFEADRVEAGFIRAFSKPPTSDLGVVSKYQETMKFLKAARAAWEELVEKDMLPPSTDQLRRVPAPSADG